MARRKRASPTSIPIGDCKVEIEGDVSVCQPSGKSLSISSPGAKIRISVDDSRRYATGGSRNTRQSSSKIQDEGGCDSDGYMFALINPKDIDGNTKSPIQEILNIYNEELPNMNYAANTGKESLFLEKCVSSGKYRTLVLKSDSLEGNGEAIAAASYQIIPADTQYAEIPLAAVSSKYQGKGIGRLLYNELKERLRSVGISTIFCWADKQSEGFWLKQGFVSVGEVDSKGKARRLPIKADIRRALCFPGDSTLMITFLKKDAVASINSSKYVSLCSLKSHASLPVSVHSRTTALKVGITDASKKSSCETVAIPPSQQTENVQPQQSIQTEHPIDGGSPRDFRLTYNTNSVPSINLGNNTSGNDLGGLETGHFPGSKHYSPGLRVKRAWEASLYSLTSKRVRGGHPADNSQEMKGDFAFDIVRDDAAFGDCSLASSQCKQISNATATYSFGIATTRNNSEEKRPGTNVSDTVLKESGPKIMLMDIADDVKRKSLTKIVEELGGSVTCDGSISTHVLTMKARRTLNFCIALCSGAWIVSPTWLKASFREGKFLGEPQFLLDDDEYHLKYKSKLSDVVMRARENPHSLLKGYDVCIAKHIQPSVDILSAIIKSAGGTVIRRLDGVQEPSKSVFVACEEDMEEALVAAKEGVWTFTSDWLMSCVMKQELDFEAPQFFESL